MSLRKIVSLFILVICSVVVLHGVSSPIKVLQEEITQRIPSSEIWKYQPSFTEAIQNNIFSITLLKPRFFFQDNRFRPQKCILSSNSLFSKKSPFFRMECHGGTLEINCNENDSNELTQIRDLLETLCLGRRIRSFSVKDLKLLFLRQGKKIDLNFRRDEMQLSGQFIHDGGRLDFSRTLVHNWQFTVEHFTCTEILKPLLPLLTKLPIEMHFTGTVSTSSIETLENLQINGRLDCRLLQSSGEFVSSSTMVEMVDEKILLSPGNSLQKLSGTIDQSGKLLQFALELPTFDLSWLDSWFNSDLGFLRYFSPAGLGNMQLQYLGQAEKNELRGALIVNNGILKGKQGIENITNLRGEFTFRSEEVTINELVGNFRHSPFVLSGILWRTVLATHYKLLIDVVNLNVEEFLLQLTSFKIAAPPLSNGRISMKLDVQGKSTTLPEIIGSGTMDGCTLTLLDEMLQLNTVTGRFTFSDQVVDIPELYGFWGGLPFEGKGRYQLTQYQDSNLKLRFSGFTNEDLDSSFMDILSRIDFSNQSVGAIQIDDNHEKTGASVDFSLRDVTLNLFPLPINIQLPTLGGKLLFEQVRNGFIRWVSGVYQYGDRLEFRMHFPFLSSIPLHLTGEGGGKVQLNVEESGGVDLKDQLHFSQLKGSFFNSQHQELFFELEHCSVAYQYKLGELSFEVSFSLLSGTVKITGSVRLTGDLPVRCEIEVKNLDCQYFYQMNPKIWRVLSGQISGILVHQACRGENLTSITFLVENGVLRNLPLISDWFREELENKIYYLPFKKIEMKGKIENHQFHVEEILADGEEELQKIISTVKRDFILEKKKTSDSFWKPYLDYFHRCYTPLKTFFEGKKWGFPKGFPLINSYQ